MRRAVRNIVRLIRIARILARYDALFLLDFLELGPVPARLARLVLGRRRPGRQPLRRGQRIAAALQELGPSFIKFGQSWSTRADLIGERMAGDLGELRDRLPPFSVEAARATIESEFDRPVDELFPHFEPVPVAAASIAQVHFAVTAEGREVAVKVLRPGIEAAFRRDLDLFQWLAELVERTQPQARRLKPVEIVRNFAAIVDLEMDLRSEAAAASELARNFEGDPRFRVPEVDWARTSRRVLTLERMAGTSLNDRAALDEAGIDATTVTENLLRTFLTQVFHDGFFHADLHPGNLFADADANLLAVDFGIMGRLDLQTRIFVADLLLAFLKRDYERAAEVHFEAGYVPRGQSLNAFTQALRAIGEPILGRPAQEISIGRLLAQLLQTTTKFEMETQPQLLLLQKTMVVAEGVSRSLDPEVMFWDIAQPVIEDWIGKNMGPDARLRDAAFAGARLVRRLPALAERAEAVLGEIASDGLKLHPDTARLLQGNGRRRWPPERTLLWAAIAILALAILF